MTTDFEFAGEKLSDYGMMLCTLDSSGGLETISSGADITFHQIKPCAGNTFYISSSGYENALTTTFQICKIPCDTHPNEPALSTTELSAIQRWLCRKNQSHKFKLYKENYEHLYWNAAFSAKQITLNDCVIGMELTLYTDAPYAYMDAITLEKDCSRNLTFDVYDVSDEIGWIYPDMKITFLEDGKGKLFQLTNSLDVGRTMEIQSPIINEVITIHGKSHIIETSAGRSLTNQFNYCFPRIVNSYEENKNTFTCSLKCKITLSYSPIRKVGF